ncbi:MAG: 1-(5-phosphoribosyl)-5-[(5-phosphoribosylamino)methylideneamino] imidazole-4-carboxamide isomerase [Chitinophagaceae bacterium]|nr:MAG: 1-(5-phosphoribosyl)-5-[(5-phosphoribosylamino)methylideneamino] imidazole-4-carboxamide isomerase [Chitinophagaceae bacterium]
MQKKVYNENPLEVAKQFEASGIIRLHLVDLDGARAGRIINWKVLENIAAKTTLAIDFGGGIKTEKDIEIIFDSGAVIATIGSIAIKQAELFYQWLQKYGGEKILLGADVKDEKMVIHGWTEQTETDIFDFLQENINQGLKQAFCTDVSKDGLLQGPSLGLYKKIIEKFPDLYFIASGGVSSLNDLVQLKEIGCKGVIVGKAIYEGKIKIKDLQI